MSPFLGIFLKTQIAMTSLADSHFKLPIMRNADKPKQNIIRSNLLNCLFVCLFVSFALYFSYSSLFLKVNKKSSSSLKERSCLTAYIQNIETKTKIS